MSLDQLLFLVMDALITTLLVKMVLRRRKSEAAASEQIPTSDDLSMTTTTVAPGTMSAASPSPTPPVSRPFYNPASGSVPRATAVTRPSGATPTAEASAPETGSLTRMFGRGQLRGLATFAAEQNERISAYVHDNWKGVPDQLPAVLDALLTQLEHDAEEKGLWLDRETLKSMLVVALRSNRVVDNDVVLEALEKVA